jgi:catechol 2,3-dioxygenase-like lactoylglutathione lyase family enzyme
MQRIISGIQQVGIGVSNACEAFQWYKEYFGFDAVVFEDKAPASLMTRYTGDTVQHRYAVLAMNMQGGGGFELWQYTSRQPVAANTHPQLGDTGIFAVKLRCRNVQESYKKLFRFAVTPVSKSLCGALHFFVKDPFGNLFEIMENAYWFTTRDTLIGGVCGAMIGVKDMQVAKAFYSEVLGYDVVHAEEEKIFEDWQGLPGAGQKVKRVVMRHSAAYTGPFSRLLGPTTIELVQAVEKPVAKIFAGRWWGDLGFIHLCYDVGGMQEHAKICAGSGHPLTVNSNDSFAMGQAAGHFAYNEDPDGTLIEYVETHKVPILKKLGWYLDLRKRDASKPLPDWMVKCMGFGKKTLQLSN